LNGCQSPILIPIKPARIQSTAWKIKFVAFQTEKTTSGNFFVKRKTATAVSNFSLNNHTVKELNLQNSISLLNDFCADAETFSYHKMAHLKLWGMILQVDGRQGEVTIVVSASTDYQFIQDQLMPGRRFYQLLGLHFKRVHLRFGRLDEAVSNSIYLETIALVRFTQSPELRDVNALGSRLRRTLNVALQGHIGVLRLHNDDEVKQLKKLWERGRITQLIEQYGIIPFDDSSGQLVKLWKPRRLEPGEEVVIIID
jgi:hypothetical protein